MLSVKVSRLIAYAFVSLSIIGAVISYSPVPFWDMWNGYLGFFVKATDGNWLAWWLPHNEHRILLSRILFWIDIKIFGGLSWFLITCNFLILFSVFALLRSAIREQLVSEHRGFYRLISALVLALLFSWIQEENITWGFQTQFFLSLALPLASFLLLHRSVIQSRGRAFFLSCVAGVASLGTMANGVIVLPLLFFLGLVLRIRRIRLIFLGALAVTGPVLYFYGYEAPASHGSLTKALIEQPIDLIIYVLTYIGGPLYYMTGASNLIIAQVAGALLIFASAKSFWTTVRAHKPESLRLALLTFLLFIGATALGTAGGRLPFGVTQALSGRYMTVAITAWCALIVLLLPEIHSLYQKRKSVVIGSVFAFFIGMLPAQLTALNDKSGENFEREVAALSLELGIKDHEQVRFVFPSAEWALQIVKAPTERDLSIFGQKPIHNASQLIGAKAEQLPIDICQGALDETVTLPDGEDYARVRGWLFNSESQTSPRSIHFVNREGVVVGFALTGMFRPDVRDVIHGNAASSGFKGYIRRSETGQDLSLVSADGGCYLRAQSPGQLYVISHAGNELHNITLTAGDIVGDVSMNGSDFSRSTLSGMTVIGSYARGDQDVGSVSIRVKKNDTLLYRSGPTGGSQYMLLNDDIHTKHQLPVSESWALLQFSSELLPEQFIVTFVDGGTAWGEWSAIAVKSATDR